MNLKKLSAAFLAVLFVVGTASALSLKRPDFNQSELSESSEKDNTVQKISSKVGNDTEEEEDIEQKIKQRLEEKTQEMEQQEAQKKEKKGFLTAFFGIFG
jgi:hypothetical protein